MKYFFTLFIAVASLFIVERSNAQSGLNNSHQWNASWIAARKDPGNEYGVYYFRKSIDLTAKPSAFIIHVSADNRYKLYVNGTLVSLGPARGDTYFWNYETVDIAPYLTVGKNLVSALVFNEADFSPAAQISVRTALIIQGNSTNEDILNTNDTWRCVRDTVQARAKW
jgi:alpha-L-rhamnosidase